MENEKFNRWLKIKKICRMLSKMSKQETKFNKHGNSIAKIFK